MAQKPILKVWTFRSDSNRQTEYPTLQHVDGSTSCNCAGWTRRVADNGSRPCKHTRWVDLGTAARHCSAFPDYAIQPSTPTSNQHAQRKIPDAPNLGQRKFAV